MSSPALPAAWAEGLSLPVCVTRAGAVSRPDPSLWSISMQLTTSLIDLSAISKAPTATSPYPFFIGADFLSPEAVRELRRDFPDIRKPGFLTVPEVEMRGSFRRFIDELEGPELADAVSAKIGIDLDPFP